MIERTTNRSLSLCILNILHKYTDAEHKLTQANIISYLEKEYNMSCERKAISKHIDALIDQQHDIALPGEGGYYLRSRDFEDGELRLLVDSVLANRQIPREQAVKLIEKLKNQGNIYFAKQIRHVTAIKTWTGHDMSSLFYNIEVIDEAIFKEKKVAFNYYEYGLDKKLHKKKNGKYIFNPYQMMINNGRYYVVGNMDKYENLSTYRVDMIAEIEVLDEARKSPKDVLKDTYNIQLADYDKYRVYPFDGKEEIITIRISNSIIGDIIDYFGEDFILLPIDKMFSLVKLKTIARGFCYWALQYGEYVEVVSPKSLREKIRETVHAMAEKYSK